jgi:uncharacterized membrane protein YpjA
MKNVVLTILQLILFLIVFFVGSIIPPFHLEHVLIATPGTTRIFVADGLVVALILYILIVIVEVVRKRLRTAAPWTTLAFLLAVVFGLMMKFGFKTTSAF